MLVSPLLEYLYVCTVVSLYVKLCMFLGKDSVMHLTSTSVFSVNNDYFLASVLLKLVSTIPNIEAQLKSRENYRNVMPMHVMTLGMVFALNGTFLNKIPELRKPVCIADKFTLFSKCLK